VRLNKHEPTGPLPEDQPVSHHVLVCARVCERRSNGGRAARISYRTQNGVSPVPVSPVPGTPVGRPDGGARGPASPPAAGSRALALRRPRDRTQARGKRRARGPRARQHGRGSSGHERSERAQHPCGNGTGGREEDSYRHGGPGGSGVLWRLTGSHFVRLLLLLLLMRTSTERKAALCASTHTLRGHEQRAHTAGARAARQIALWTRRSVTSHACALSPGLAQRRRHVVVKDV